MNEERRGGLNAAADRRPSAEVVRAALERLLASADFARSKRMSDFLRYLVESSLNGEADRIKEEEEHRTTVSMTF